MNTTKHYWVMLFLFVLSFTIYSGTLQHDFVNFDDPALAFENNDVRKFDLKKIFTSTIAEDYIPLTVASYAIDHALFGMNPLYFHLHNVILNGLNVVLVFLFLFYLTAGNFSVSTLSALLFAVHPLHVESVAWVAERKDVLSAFFSMLALILYVRLLDRRNWYFYGLSILCFALALFAKFMAVSVPAVLLLIELQRQQPLKKSLLRLLPFAVISLVFTYIHISLHNSGTSTTPISIFRGIDSLAFYLSKTFYPVGLSVFYEQGVTKVNWLEYIFAGVVITAFVLACVRLKKQRRLLLFGAGFFLLTIFPVLQIVPFGHMFAFGDRFMYFPSIGLFLVLSVVALSLTEVHQRWKNHSLNLLWSAILILLAILSFQRTNVWQNSKSLWSDAVQTYPKSGVAHNNLGHVYLNEGKQQMAISEFDLATKLRNDYADPFINMGLAYLDLNQLPEAETALNEALKINPKTPSALVNMALVLEAKNQLESAGEYYLKALQYDADYSSARYNLGVIYYRLKLSDKALEVFKETTERHPNIAEAYHGIGVILSERGDLAGAVPAFIRASELDRFYEAPRIQLINIYNKQGRADLVAQEVAELQQVKKELELLPPSRPRR